MADFGFDDRPESECSQHSESVGGTNLLDNDEAVGGIIKSLISSTGLQAAWKRFGVRLRVVEKGVKKNESVIEKMPQDFISRAEYHDFVVEQQGGHITSNVLRIESLEKSLADLSRIVREDHRRELDEKTVKWEKADARADEHHGELTQLATQMQASFTGVHNSVQSVHVELETQRTGGFVNKIQLKESIDEIDQGIQKSLQALETRLQDFAHSECDRSLVEMLVMHHKSGQDKTHQKALLKLIDNTLIHPVTKNLNQTTQGLQHLSEKVETQKCGLEASISQVKKIGLDANTRISKVNTELKEDLGTRAKQAEVQNLDEAAKRKVAVLHSDTELLRETVLRKLNEFVDHLSKLHETLDDHEHCIRHHAEEIENRGTKYDLLVCRSQIDRCSLKEDVSRELVEMKQSITWQSSKIESFSLGVGAGGGGRSGRKKGRIPTMTSIAGSESARSHRSDDQMSEIDPPGPDTAKRDSDAEGAAAAGRDDTPQMASNTDTITPPLSPKNKQPEGQPEVVKTETALTMASIQANQASMKQNISSIPLKEEQHEESSSDEDETGSKTLFKMQLECMAQAIAGLGYLSSRELKAGETKIHKQEAIMEFLGEVDSLAQWIGKNIVPSGWNPTNIGKLTFVHRKDMTDRTARRMSAEAAASVRKAIAQRVSPERNRDHPHSARERRDLSPASRLDKNLLIASGRAPLSARQSVPLQVKEKSTPLLPPLIIGGIG